jgi:predicted AAA+ superfamily ATPase
METRTKRGFDDLGRAKTMFTSIPNSLSQNVSRYQVSTYVPGESATRLATVIQAMEDSKTVNVAYHSNDPQVGLALTRDAFRFKMYTADTGLFVTLAFKTKDFTENIIYEKLLNDKLSANLGYVYENMVAQMLSATGKDLYYHTIPYAGGKKFYEIDFVISDGFKVSPIEVKSSGYRTHASLDAFCQKYSDRIQNRYLVYTKNLKREGGVDYIPIYMTPFL